MKLPAGRKRQHDFPISWGYKRLRVALQIPKNVTMAAWLSLIASEKQKNNSSTWIPQRPPLHSYILLMTLTRASQGKHDKIDGREV